MTASHGAGHGHGHGSAAADGGAGDGEAPIAFWERRYSGAEPIWSGRVNATLAAAVGDLAPGSSLDLGCGEGGDVRWLASRGWRAVGIELSPTAVSRAEAATVEAGLGGDRARFVVADLGEWAGDPAGIDGGEDRGFDLVTASFFQSPVELPRQRILRAAAGRVAPGGRLVLVSHAAAPSWAPGHGGDFPSPESELAMLDPAPDGWETVTAEVRTRAITGPDGAPATLDDTVVVLRRR
ncbi:class I SAM-dependent methyltransferase [Leucobacter iarius]|uniref:Class I SAM-dependent methyltransferase n=1 Tax=Leucobacter iarius TaxID=333963 RepID=A0ABP4Y0J2_9MICO